MTEETVEKLIERIAVEHHVTLDKEDPILILHTMNQMIVEENKANQSELLKELSQNLEIYLLKLTDKSKVQLEMGANAAIRASKEVSVSIIEESTKRTKEQVKRTIEETIEIGLKKIYHQSKSNRKTAYINLFTSLLLFMGFLFFLLTIYLQSN